MSAKRPTILKDRMTMGRAVLALGLLAGLMSACEYADPTYYEPKQKGQTQPVRRTLGEAKKKDSVFGEGGLTGMLGGKGGQTQGGGGGVAVNLYLWRASLETISFMPLSSTDPFGGVIITDWYVLPETPNERFKVNVYITDVALRADGVKVSVFRELRGPSGEWASAPVDKETVTGLENSILTRARELRMAATVPQ